MKKFILLGLFAAVLSCFAEYVGGGGVSSAQLAAETSARESADGNLQDQIDLWENPTNGITQGVADTYYGGSNAVAAVYSPDNLRIGYFDTIQDAADALTDGGRLEILRPVYTTTNLYIALNNGTIDGNGIPIHIERFGYTPSHSIADQKACVVFKGTNTVFNNLVLLGEDAVGYPTNNHFYAFVNDATGVKDVYFNNCRIQGNFNLQYTGVGAPKVFVATSHTNIVFNGGAIGYYTPNGLTSNYGQKIVDCHEDYSSLHFVGTKFYASKPDLFSAGDPPFNTAGDYMLEDTFTDCSYNGREIYCSAGSTNKTGLNVQSNPMTLADVRSVCFPSTESLFTQSDIMSDGLVLDGVYPYSGARFGYLQKPRVTNSEWGYYIDSYEVERYQIIPSSATEQTFNYSKSVVLDGSTVQSDKGIVVAPFGWTRGTPGVNYWTNNVITASAQRTSIRCYGICNGTSAAGHDWSVMIRDGVVTSSDGGTATYPSSSDLRFIMTSYSNMTVTAGSQFTVLVSGVTRVTGIFDRDQTDETNLYVRAWSDINYTTPADGSTIVYNGVTYTNAYKSKNISGSGDLRGFYLTDIGWAYYGRTVGPCLFEVWMKTEDQN